MSEVTYEWVEVGGGSAAAKRFPKWMRLAALSSDGVVYIPSAVVGEPMEVFWAASYDGTPALLDGDHAYYPVDWVAREFPRAAATARNLEKKVKECLGVAS